MLLLAIQPYDAMGPNSFVDAFSCVMPSSLPQGTDLLLRRARRVSRGGLLRQVPRARAHGDAPRGLLLLQSGRGRGGVRARAAAIARCAAACGDAVDASSMARCLDRDVGAVRLSLGLANNARDVERTVAVVASFAD
jgi:hypothetical protein